MIYNQRPAHCNRQLDGRHVPGAEVRRAGGARLLLPIHLFNYIDRQILAVLEPQIRWEALRVVDS